MNENILVKVGADVTGLQKSLSSASSDLSSFGKSVGGMSKAIAGAAAVGFGALAVGVGKSVSMFVDFDTELRKAGAIAGASTAEFDKMKAAAIDLGGKSSKSASEIAKAYTELAAKGFDANEVMAAMPGIVAAAEASGEDLAMTADTIASALNIWGLEAKESSKVADVLAMSANVSAAGIDDLANVMNYAGAPAAALGISLEEVAAAAGIMANAGLSGSNAGTSLRASLLALNNPAKAQAKIMDELGFSILDSEGNAKGLSQMIGELGVALEGETEAQKVATLSKLVGTEAVSGFLALMKAGPTEIEKMSESLRNSGGASQEAADKMKAGIGGALEQLIGSVESVALSIGDVLAPDLKMLATRLSEIDTTKLIAGFKDFYERGKDAVKVIGDFLDKWSPLLTGVAAGIVAFKTITFGIAAYNTVMAAYRAIVIAGTAVQWSLNAALVANPIGAVVLLIGLLVTAGVLLYKNWDKIVAKTKELWSAIKTRFTEIKNTITEKWNQVMAFFRAVDLRQIGMNIIGGLIGGIAGKATELYNKAKEIANAVKNTFKNLFDINSPSRFMRDMIGENMIQGWINGVTGMKADMISATSKAGEWMTPSAPTLSYTTPGTSHGSLSGALSGAISASVNVNESDEARLLGILISAVREGQVISLDGRKVGESVAKTVGETLQRKSDMQNIGRGTPRKALF